MGVYRSHYAAPDDGDEDRPRTGRHAAPEDDYPDQEDYPHYPDPGYGVPAAAALAGSRVDPDLPVPGYDTTSDSSRRNGTVYGRPRQADSRAEGPADAAGDYDPDPYAPSAGGYGPAAAHHSRHDPVDDGYQDDFGDNGYRGRYHERGDDYYDDGYGDERDRYDDEPPYRDGYAHQDDEPGYNRGRRRTDDYDDRDRKKPRDAMDGVRAGVRGFGELLITFGLVVLLFAGYEVWGKSAQVDAAQNALDDKLEDTWGGEKAPKEKPLPGDAIARLHIPRLDKHWVVVEGVAPADIKNAPGHYPDSAMPGKLGNFSVAGHRMPAVFWYLDKMQNGDKIFLEDSRYWYEYRVTEVKIVLPNQVEVVAPVPGEPGAKPTEAMLTITTCNPRWDNYERLIVHAKMAGKPKPKSDGRPIELAD